MLYKFSWTTSEIRAMGIRAIENRVRRGMPVLQLSNSLKGHPVFFYLTIWFEEKNMFLSLGICKSKNMTSDLQ